MSYKSEYNKQRKRILSFLERNERKGFYFDYVLPNTPKRITQGSVNRLKKMTSKELWKKASYVTNQGEKLSVEEGKALIKKSKREHEDYLKSLETPRLYNVNKNQEFYSDIIISGFRSHIAQFNERAHEILSNWLNRLLATNDKEDVAKMLDDGAEAGNILTYQIVYSTDKLTEYIGNMMEYLPEAGTMYKEGIMEALEEDEWNEVE